ncbi:MAG: hypothetical protein ACLUE8_02845 [Lachnospiraceae bacterium]
MPSEIEDESLDLWNSSKTANGGVPGVGTRCTLTDEAPDHRLKLSIATLTTLLVGLWSRPAKSCTVRAALKSSTRRQ